MNALSLKDTTMYGELVTVAQPQARPVQFSLRHVAVWIVWISIGLALFSQIGTWWGLASRMVR